MKRIAVVILSFALIAGSCKSWNKTKKGAAIGAGTGAAAGAVIGKAAGDKTILGAIIGAAVGGATGAAIGRYMDKQAEEIQRDVKGAKVERVGEGIKITFDSGLLFDVNSTTLKGEGQNNIQELAKVLQKYDDTEILIEGHTDNTGEDKYNQELSVKRAESVSNSVKMQGIKGSRITTVGYGETQPLESNESAEGRSQNRRVDIAIMANKKLKKAAKRGDIK
ncbi:MAG: OmpA family protein [Bacteroidetes bacterium]|jgi:outer membrane protein OmpA-like peptidoglycan-associated protein|nr:OmpA family protein [Bacteroidota bacterium]